MSWGRGWPYLEMESSGLLGFSGSTGGSSLSRTLVWPQRPSCFGRCHRAAASSLAAQQTLRCTPVRCRSELQTSWAGNCGLKPPHRLPLQMVKRLSPSPKITRPGDLVTARSRIRLHLYPLSISHVTTQHSETLKCTQRTYLGWHHRGHVHSRQRHGLILGCDVPIGTWRNPTADHQTAEDVAELARTGVVVPPACKLHIKWQCQYCIIIIFFLCPLKL